MNIFKFKTNHDVLKLRKTKFSLVFSDQHQYQYITITIWRYYKINNGSLNSYNNNNKFVQIRRGVKLMEVEDYK